MPGEPIPGAAPVIDTKPQGGVALTYQPENLPNPLDLPLNKSIGVDEAPLFTGQNLGAKNETSQVPDQKKNIVSDSDLPYLLVQRLYESANSPEGFSPTLEQANEYTLQALKAAYPDRPFVSGIPVETVVAGISTGLLEKMIADQKAGRVDVRIVSHYALTLAEKMKTSFESYLRELIRTQVYLTSGGNESYANAISRPEALLGPEIEHRFLMRAQGSKFSPYEVGSTDLVAMKTVGHYRSFAMAEETLNAAREQRSVNREMAKSLWKANNVRQATVGALKGSPEKAVPVGGLNQSSQATVGVAA